MNNEEKSVRVNIGMEVRKRLYRELMKVGKRKVGK
jgi:hypothetical protein